MLRRIIEICTTLETGRWNGNSSTELIEDEPLITPQKSCNLNAGENRESSSPVNTSSNVMRNKNRKRASISQQSSTSESALSSTQKRADSKPSGTANITSVTTLDLGNLEKEKRKSILQQQQDAFLKAVILFKLKFLFIFFYLVRSVSISELHACYAWFRCNR